MNNPPVSILVVEDDEDHAKSFKELLETPHRNWPAAGVVPKFKMVLAKTGQEAEHHIEKAYSSGTVFGLLLLDLKLPYAPPEEAEEDVGFDILRKVKGERRSVCGGVAVASDHIDFPFVREALQLGADDYVEKRNLAEGRNQAAIYNTCVSVYRKGVANAWAALRQEWGQTLVRELSCACLADDMARIVSDGVTAMLSGLDDLDRQLQERYHLHLAHDRDDPLCRTLSEVRDTAGKVKRKCAEERSHWVGRGDEVKTVHPAQVLKDVEDWLRPGLLYYGVTFDRQGSEQLYVETFRDDLELIVKAVLFSALEATGETAPSGAAGKSLVARVARDDTEKAVVVTVEDMAAPLPEELCAALTDGKPIRPMIGKGRPDPARARGEGLSLAQQVARGIGVHLSVARSPSGAGNTITLRLPGVA